MNESPVSMVSAVPALRRVCINKSHRSKTLHLLVEVNNYIVEGLVDTGASMTVMAVVVVRELGMMHMVTGSETYKTASGVITQALGRIDEVPVKVGGVQCAMTFMVVDTDSYDVLLGLDFLMKIGAIVDVERGLIQVRHGPGANVEVLPLTVVNMMQRVESTNMMPEPTPFWQSSPTGDKCDRIADQEHAITPGEDAAISSDTDSGTEGSEHGEVFADLVRQYESEDEFGEDELAKLIKAEGPPEILQLILQGQEDDFMKEEVTDGDDYADWIRWVADAEQSMREERVTKCTTTLASQQQRTLNTVLVPTLLQVGTVGSSESEHPIAT